MKRLTAIIAVLALLLPLLTACGGDAVPAKVAEYAKKHNIEVLTADKVRKETVVGKSYVVYGTVSEIYFWNYEKGSEDLEKTLSNLSGSLKEQMEKEFLGTMRYSVYFQAADSLSFTYSDLNFPSSMLKINKGDEVAFLITCKDGYEAGEYNYEIKDKVWVERRSETTVEEDHDAKIEGK